MALLLKRLCPFLLFLALAPALLWPNMLGNQPDALADESYFLTSALSAIQKHTLPGWEFSHSGAYYGGVQAYVDVVALAPVLAWNFVAEGFSFEGLRMYVATHTGDLLHALRLVNGLSVFGLLVFAFFYLRAREIPQPLAMQLGLLAVLLLGNSVVVMLAHTAKVWVFYIVLELLAAGLVLIQEHYLRRRGEPFLRTPVYIALLSLLGVFAFFQTFVGVASTGLWFVWAWWLGHFKVREAWEHFLKFWYVYLILGATQISFFWRAFVDRPHGSTLLDFGGFTTPGEGGESRIVWAHRIWAPLQDAFMSQPLLLLFPLLVLLLLFVSYRKLLDHSWRYLAVAVVHPIWAYAVFYLLLGFDTAPRYALMLALATSISIVMLVPLRGRVYVLVAALGSLLALAVLAQSVMFYWSPSRQSMFLEEVGKHSENKEVAFVLDPSAVALQLPMNARSLKSLGEGDRAIGRYAYLLSNLEGVESRVNFQPLVLYTHSKEELQSALSRAQTEAREVFLITLPSGSDNTAEPNTLQRFFSADRLGQNYFLEKVLP